MGAEGLGLRQGLCAACMGGTIPPSQHACACMLGKGTSWRREPGLARHAA